MIHQLESSHDKTDFESLCQSENSIHEKEAKWSRTISNNTNSETIPVRLPLVPLQVNCIKNHRWPQGLKNQSTVKT